MNRSEPTEIAIHGYIDGELEGAALADFERRLETDDALRRRVESERRLRERTARALIPEPAPESLRDRVRELVRSDDAAAARTRAGGGPASPLLPPDDSSGRSADRLRRRFFFRVVGVAAALLLLIAIGSLLRPDGADSSGLPRLVRESVALFEEALSNEVSAAEPDSIPALEGFRFERAFTPR